VGGGDEEHAEKGIMNKEFKKEKGRSSATELY
jgi:hypothetical protein